MSDRLKYERFYWFHGRIKSSRYPNAARLVEEFEISPRTAQRDIDFMRVHLEAPLEFDRCRRGYFYTDDSFELPGHWFSETNILALALAIRLASTIPDHAFKDDLCRLINRVLHSTGKRKESCLEHVSERVSVKNIEYSQVDDWCFRQVVQALFDDSSLLITYHSPHTGKTSTRNIRPLHLMHYMGSWYLLAWCAKSCNIRDFALSRIKTIDSSPQRIELPKGLPSLKEYTRRHFGIMQGADPVEAVLRFSPQSAGWVNEQIWHPEQKTTIEADGSLLLQFTVADFRELVKKILSHGAGVKVVSPPELQNLVREEIAKMAKIY
ncbi:MAG: WYL domain-containing protein [Proteobacteria bacterium]|nr:WYL domain-containing protein [Pseudomonadota bacterium]MBU4296143.1 WYL domain-containing protein [Pseudomonadota bacterium]MCG2747461.1 WYL domain-containing protein [Desulfobulbaceae bacterium]